VRDALDSWDRVVRRASRGQLDLRAALPGALAAAGVGVLLFGKRRIPEWYDLLFWSFVTFVNLNPTAKDGHPDGDRATPSELLGEFAIRVHEPGAASGDVHELAA